MSGHQRGTGGRRGQVRLNSGLVHLIGMATVTVVASAAVATLMLTGLGPWSALLVAGGLPLAALVWVVALTRVEDRRRVPPGSPPECLPPEHQHTMR